MSRDEVTIRLDRTQISAFALGAEPSDRDYWLSRSPEERFAMVEFLRRQFDGHDSTTKRLQRLIRTVSFGEG